MTEPDRFHPTSFTTITVEIDEAAKVAVVTLDRPEAYNAFSPTMQEELKATWRAFRSDDRVNAIVLTAAGDTSFCVGIDRNEAEFTNMAGDSRCTARRTTSCTTIRVTISGRNRATSGNR